MPLTFINPEGLPNTDANRYKQVAIATGSRQIYVARRIATDAQEQLVAPGDVFGQVAQAYRNVATALAVTGTTFENKEMVCLYLQHRSAHKVLMRMEIRSA